jgi:hypothetical protein
MPQASSRRTIQNYELRQKEKVRVQKVLGQTKLWRRAGNHLLQISLLVLRSTQAFVLLLHRKQNPNGYSNWLNFNFLDSVTGYLINPIPE